MPKLADHQSAEVTKLLLMGESGSGKTGALASLAQAGYNLRILDLDNGLDVLFNILRNRSKDALSRVDYVTITDPMKHNGSAIIPRKVTVWNRAIKMLEKWQELSERPADLPPETVWKPEVLVDLGAVQKWTPQDVLVIDSLTFLCNAAMYWVLSVNNKLGDRVEQSHWGAAQNLVEQMLQMLYDESVNCIIMLAHITVVGDEGGGIGKGLPASLGKALSPKIGRYFNNVVMAKASGVGQNVKRQILTSSTQTGGAVVELKTSNPIKAKPIYDLDTGLADLFRDLRS